MHTLRKMGWVHPDTSLNDQIEHRARRSHGCGISESTGYDDTRYQP
jgi:hypothetical protein